MKEQILNLSEELQAKDERIKELEESVKNLTSNYKLLQSEQHSRILEGQALVDEFGDLAAIQEYINELKSKLQDTIKVLEAIMSPEIADEFEYASGVYTYKYFANRIKNIIKQLQGETR